MTAAKIDNETIAIIGGTGQLGGALATRLSRAGLNVFIGSRDPERAVRFADDLGGGAQGGSNELAAEKGSIVILTVPFAYQADTLRTIRPHCEGKIVVDTTVPLCPPKVMRVQMPEEGAAALIAQECLGPEVLVVSAFHNIPAHKLQDPDWQSDCDVLVFGDKKDARATVVEIAEAAGLRGLHAGSLQNSAAAEAMTSVIIFINKFYEVDGAGIKVTGSLRGVAD